MIFVQGFELIRIQMGELKKLKKMKTFLSQFLSSPNLF